MKGLHPENMVPLADLGLSSVHGSQEAHSPQMPVFPSCLAVDELPFARGVLEISLNSVCPCCLSHDLE